VSEKILKLTYVDTHRCFGVFPELFRKLPKWKVDGESFHDQAAFAFDGALEGDESVTTASLQRDMDAEGTAVAIISPFYQAHSHLGYDNNKLVLESISKSERMFGVLWVTPMIEDSERRKMVLLNQAVNRKVKGLLLCPGCWGWLYSIDPETWPIEMEKAMEEIVDFSRDNALILQCYTGHGSNRIRDYTRFIEWIGSEQTIHLMHMGGTLGGHLDFLSKIIPYIEKGFPIIFDASLSYPFAVNHVYQVLKRTSNGLGNFLFASASPWSNVAVEVCKLKYFIRDPGDLSRVLRDNALKWYGLPS